MHIDQNKEYATFKIERKESGDIKNIFRSQHYNTESRLHDRDEKEKKKKNYNN